MCFSKSILQARHRAGLSLRELARRLVAAGIPCTAQQISEWERGLVEPRVSAYLAILRACARAYARAHGRARA